MEEGGLSDRGRGAPAGAEGRQIFVELGELTFEPLHGGNPAASLAKPLLFSL